MEIRIKIADNGVLSVNTNAVNVFKQHVMNDQYVRNYATLVELFKYRLFGVVKEERKLDRVGELIVTRDAKGQFQVYELVFDQFNKTYQLVKVAFDGNDTLYTTYDEAFDACSRSKNARFADEANRVQTDYEKLQKSKLSPKAFPDEQPETTVPDFYKDIVSTILKVAASMADENAAKINNDSKNKQPNAVPTKPASQEPVMLKEPVVPSAKTVKNMSLADKIRFEHMQERLAYCQENIRKHQHEMDLQRQEIDNWVKEANHYVEEAKAIIERNKQ